MILLVTENSLKLFITFLVHFTSYFHTTTLEVNLNKKTCLQISYYTIHLMKTDHITLTRKRDLPPLIKLLIYWLNLFISSKNIGLSVSIVSMLGLNKLWVNRTHINTVQCIYKGDTDVHSILNSIQWNLCMLFTWCVAARENPSEVAEHDSEKSAI